MKKVNQHNILSTTIIVIFISIVGKVIGFIREAIIAAYYGANSFTDAFFFAQSMPSMLFPAVCSSISTAFISLYVSKTMQKGDREGKRFASQALVSSLLLSIVLSGIALLLTPYIVPIFAPGFDDKTLSLAIKLTRLTMGSFLLIMSISMISAMLNSKKFFYGVQIAGVIYNIFIITVTLYLGRGQSVEALTITVVGGTLVHALVLLLYSRKRILLTIIANPFHTDIKAMYVLALPILLGNSVVQVQNIVDKALASTLTQGAISALSYSNSLNSIVVSVIIISLSTVLFPTLTENVASENMDKYSKNLVDSLSLLIIILLPVSIITIFFAANIVSIVFERGSFDSVATQMTASALVFYSIKYIFTAIREVLIRGFYALKDTKTPMINFGVGVGFNIVFSLILTPIMGIAGIALGSSISSIVSSFMLLFNIKKRVPELPFTKLIPSVKKLILSSVVTSVSLLIFTLKLQITSPLLRFTLGTITGFGIYIGMLVLLKCDELMLGISLVKNKLKYIINK